MTNMNYIKTLVLQFLSSKNKVKFNLKLQQMYYNSGNYYDLINSLIEFNLSQSIPYLASGMSCYFNDQVDSNGISNLKLAEQDMNDAKFIASCFGNVINYSENNLSVLYTTLLGTTELNYGMQTFPAGIFEDVFQCSPNHIFPIQPVVGESEPDFYCRILKYKISQCPTFPLDKQDEVLYRAKRLASNFCNGKNRIYLIPFYNVLNNKASFGDVAGLRDGRLKGEELANKLDSLCSLEQLLQSFSISIDNYYYDPNMTSEFGIAIYGPILNDGITYFEVDRIYDLIQRRAKELGYRNGEIIPQDLNDKMDISFKK